MKDSATRLLLAWFAVGPPAVLAQSRDSAPSSPQAIQWQYGAFVDGAYLYDANSPSNHLFRNRGTTPRVDEFVVNMVGAYLRKLPSTASRWGLELSGHGGEDSRIFGYSATAPNVHGAHWLTHLGSTNASYLAPLGNGITIQGGIFSSFIGYDGLYSKDNLSYTRPWSADFTPYLMLGVNAGYPVTDRLTVTGLALNGYWHLARANNVPSFGGQVAYNTSDRITIKQTVLYGPHQSSTSLDLWRFLSNTSVERKTSRTTAALDFHVSFERVDTAGQPRAWWVATQLPLHATLRGPWSVTLRPEFAWDGRGRWTTSEQTVIGLTSTLDYRAPVGPARVIVRMEHRYDRSTGPGGGFYKDIQPAPLVPTQHLLSIGVVLIADGSSPLRP